MAAFMGVSRQAVQQEIARDLRKFRLRLLEKCPEAREFQLSFITQEKMIARF